MSTKNFLIGLVCLVVIGSVAGYFATKSGPDQNNDTRTVKLYYYNPDLDKDAGGNVQCSSAGLVAVERSLPVSQTPIQDTVKLLLAGELTEEEKSRGVTTEFPLDSLTLKGANLVEGQLTLEFSDLKNTTSGGACRAGILWHQIEATATQFAEVDSVSFMPVELFQP